MTALAKVPADRFATATDFARALETDDHSPKRIRPRRLAMPGRRAVTTAGLVAIVAAGAVWMLGRDRAPALDANRVMVFPLHESGAPSGDEGAGEAVATYIGYALEGYCPAQVARGSRLRE